MRRINPHIVDAYFQERLGFLLDAFFGKKSSLPAAWTWFRIEYQGRSSAHGHGCCRLKCDPGLIQLSQSVLKGRLAQHLIKMSDYSTWKTEYPHSTDEPYYDDCKDDEWKSVKDLEDSGLNMDMNHVMSMKEHLHKDIEDGALISSWTSSRCSSKLIICTI